MSLRIGLDLDNTIISYDRAFAVAAAGRALIPKHFSGSKQQIRDHIRALPGMDGETEWQKLQGHVYGRGIAHAEVFDGVTAFLARAKAQGATLYIVSHKTQFGHYDPDKVDLREAAREFLEARGIFAHVPKEHLFFCATRAEKISKIAELRCDVFVDDLEEVFADPDFPAGVRKLLFTTGMPESAHAAGICRDWGTIERSVFAADLVQTASAILRQPVESVTLAGGGGNSRIYHVIAAGGNYALKMYPSLKGDTRDRLSAEKKALAFFGRHGVANVPRWLGDSSGFGMMDWVEGTLANPPTEAEVLAAADFMGIIKQLSKTPEAQDFPPASEACMSGSEIVRQIDRRLEKLSKVAHEDPTLAEFLAERFIPTYGQAIATAEASYASRIAFNTPLKQGLCLIPADFGFHNALRGADGALTFIDFEYFGWDDPVKLTADFLLHPAMRLPETLKAGFRRRMGELFADDAHFTLRLNALLPLFALRWTLILLNEFLPERWSGRAFARGESEWAAAKGRQLAKAETMLKNAVPF